MEKIDSFEKMRRKTLLFTVSVINFTSTMPNSTAKFVIEKQLIRSASSIGANYVEGNGGASRKDWLNFMNIAKKSALETVYWLDVIRESGLQYDEILFKSIYDECVALTNIFVKIVKTSKD